MLFLQDGPNFGNYSVAAFKPIENFPKSVKNTTDLLNPDDRNLMYHDPLRFFEIYKKHNDKTDR